MTTRKRSQGKKLVWVIDDDQTELLLADDILASAGFLVETFSSAATALETLPLRLPDIIVLDLVMPGLSGYEFCSQLRSNPASEDIPVLIATSLDDTASIEKAYEAGATDFAAKPLDWAIEIHRIKYMLRTADLADLLKSKERETRLAKEDWERTFNSFSDVVTLLTLDFRIARANSATATALKLPLEEIVGKRCYQVFQNASSPCPNCPANQVMSTGRPSAVEYYYAQPGGEFLLTAAPVTGEGGRLLHVVHMARDLTEQKQLEKEYRQAQKMKAVGTLAGGIAHDFNNLLTVIHGYAELLRDDPGSVQSVQEFADTILQTVKRGAALTTQLLTFSRKSPSKGGKCLLQLNRTIEDLQKMLHRVLPKDVSVLVRLDAGLSETIASPDQINQVVINLTLNAAHAMPKGGTLIIETRNFRPDAAFLRLNPEFPPIDFVAFSVTDTGHGMDQTTLQRIYEPFFTTKKVGEGTGLGLSVVYGIVQDHKGQIQCRSTVGEGTIFTIYLPTAVNSPQPAGTSTHFETSTTITGSQTILVVDDEPAMRSMVSNTLKAAGYHLRLADSGETALQIYQDEGNRIDMVLLDLGMPGMGGWECLKGLLTINPGVKVLITTGYGNPDHESRALQQGAAGLIPKPYRIAELYRKIREILNR